MPQLDRTFEPLIREDFSARRLDEGWFCDSPHYRFTEAGLDTGPATGFIVNLPGHGWEALRVEVDLGGDGGAWAHCGWDGVLALSLTLNDTAHPRHEATDYQAVTAQSTQVLPPHGERAIRRLVFDFDRQAMHALVDGQRVLTSPNRRGQVFTGGVHLAYRRCVIRELRIFGRGSHGQPLYPAPSKRDAGYSLEAAVDFTDDLIPGPFDEAMFDQYFAELASWGTRRVQWIFNGRREEGQLDNWPLGADVHAAQTMDRVGELFEAGVRAAHRHGLEIMAVVKPFDMGFSLSYTPGTPQAEARGRLPRIGGPVGWITHFAAARRDLATARRPDAARPAVNETFTRIDLVKEDDAPAAIGPDDVELWISDDNATYRPYAGPLQRVETVEDYPVYRHTPSGPRPTAQRQRCRVIRLDGLELRAAFTALVVRGQAQSFANRLLDLVHVYGEHGEESRLTYAAKTRTGDYHGDYGRLEPFDRVGLEFNHYPGTPVANAGGGFDGIRAPFVLDGGLCPAAAGPASVGGSATPPERFTVLAFARGKEATALAALSPSYPQTRQWWLKWVSDALDMGADGIEFRVGNHQSEFAFAELGFEPPVREQFLQRYGVNIWASDDFDRPALRRLRGEAYTQFYREARELILARGKRMGLHVSPSMDTEPALGGAMDLHWDWRTWLTEGLADSVTFKGVWPGSRLAQEILSLTRPRRIPVIYAPYANNYFSPYGATTRKPGGEKPVDALIRMGREGGCDGFQFYEVAAAMQVKPDGQLAMLEPALRDVFQHHFA